MDFSSRPISTIWPVRSGVMVSNVKICSPRFPLSSEREAVPQDVYKRQVLMAASVHLTYHQHIPYYLNKVRRLYRV